MTKIRIRISLFTTLFFIFAGAMHAQFNISGEFRMRGEYRDGYLGLRDSSKTPYGAILGRARLLFDYKHEKLTTRFSLYDAWVFGQNNYSSDTISKNTVNIYEAFLKYNFMKDFAVKVGRTELVYNDERFLGNSSWSMWGATHDVVLAQWEVPALHYRGDIGFAINNVAPASPYLTSYLLKNYKYMGYLYEQKDFFNQKVSVAFLGIIDAFQKSSKIATTKTTKTDTLVVRDLSGNIIGYTTQQTITTTTKTTDYPNDLYTRVTVGLDGSLDLKRFDLFISGYYQGGRYKDGRKINSWFYTAWASYLPVKKLKLILGYEQLGGNDFSDTTEFKSSVKGFSTLYGTGHRFYGYMDLFSSLIRDNLSPGLNDLYFRATFNFTDKMFLEGTYRWFSIPNPYLYVANPKSGSSRYQEVDTKSLGSEIDLMYVYKPIPNLELNAAYCFFLPTATMEKMSNIGVGKSKFAQFAYLMVTYKPSFFNSEKK